MQQSVGQAVRVDPVHIGMLVEPEITRVEPRGAQVHVGGEEQAQAGGRIFDGIHLPLEAGRKGCRGRSI